MYNFLTKEEVFQKFKSSNELLSDLSLSSEEITKYYGYFLAKDKNEIELENKRREEEHRKEMERREHLLKVQQAAFDKKKVLFQKREREEVKLQKALQELEKALAGGLLTEGMILKLGYDLEEIIKAKGWKRIILDEENSYREAVATLKANTNNKDLKHLYAYDEKGNVVLPNEALQHLNYYQDQFKKIPLHLVKRKGARNHFAITCNDSFMKSEYYERYKESESESPLHKALKFDLLRTQRLDIHGELFFFEKEEIKQEYYYKIDGKPIRFDMAIVRRGEEKPYIAIEFAVTHPVDLSKKKAILNANILLIEKNYKTDDKTILTNENYIEKEILKSISINGQHYDAKYGFRADTIRDEEGRIEELNREVEKYDKERRDLLKTKEYEVERIEELEGEIEYGQLQLRKAKGEDEQYLESIKRKRRDLWETSKGDGTVERKIEGYRGQLHKREREYSESIQKGCRAAEERKDAFNRETKAIREGIIGDFKTKKGTYRQSLTEYRESETRVREEEEGYREQLVELSEEERERTDGIDQQFREREEPYKTEIQLFGEREQQQYEQKYRELKTRKYQIELSNNSARARIKNLEGAIGTERSKKSKRLIQQEREAGIRDARINRLKGEIKSLRLISDKG
ncbi:hypothetical protein [Flammeovirga sp. EKP202]|uniref:hypothetical protein n=1 Tax=Flammeovirga sp. EKP202 TaxID=2770592 RepID=UPI00165F837B|nr:hypothetical protein [Flammeovirga sp. EKP202]MBD0403232.1 hypothetical protein [Flammeovirga sp. EKP202]